ncbi:helix-turn-helix domain-containing protein [Streptomyces boluensis]|uniref:DUF2690 domain-containing protein n=1 Tax=Streptomyces boluensis TaxID=1775135 RepID=A0A964UWG8_9ACTN|nr:XRE family transcriptional regulator [Streptomyces boluensis]NBE56718.1 DUF2690 domain-containing protein [Streptomyces boluensis]
MTEREDRREDRRGSGDASRTGAAAGRAVECARLAEALRGLRSATGLSLAALAERTPYSKSSWERYLNGKALPPRQAVEQLCRLAGAPPQRPLALWELAEATWSGRATSRSPSPPSPPPPPPPAPSREAPEQVAAPRRSRSAGFLAGVAGGLAVVAAGVVLLLWGVDGSGSTAEGKRPARGAAPGPGCSGDSCTGKDPEATRCSGAALQPSTLAERRFAHGTVVKVRRSSVCGTVWARIDRGRAGDRIEITAPGIGPQQTEVRDRFDAEASLSTPMAAAGRGDHREVEACLVRASRKFCFRATATAKPKVADS